MRSPPGTSGNTVGSYVSDVRLDAERTCPGRHEVPVEKGTNLRFEAVDTGLLCVDGAADQQRDGGIVWVPSGISNVRLTMKPFMSRRKAVIDAKPECEK